MSQATAEKNSKPHVKAFAKPRVNLFGKDQETGESWYTLLKKAEEIPAASSSNQHFTKGRKAHPFNFTVAKKFRGANPHHGRCLKTSASATVGLGIMAEEEVAKLKEDKEKEAKAKAQRKDDADPGEPQAAPVEKAEADPAKPAKPPKPPSQMMKESETRSSSDGASKFNALMLRSKAEKVLDPLCAISLADVLNDVAENFWDVGNAYIEVVREAAGGKITGIHHVAAETVHLVVEDEDYNIHYEVQPAGGGLRRFAAFGDSEDFLKRGAGKIQPSEKKKTSTISEIIHIRKPSSLAKWYGYPEWLGCVAYIELQTMMVQWLFDFFNNRGIPDFFFIVTGGKVDDKQWKAIEEAIESTIGVGNQHKTAAINLEGDNLEVELKSLAGEGKQDSDLFAKTIEQLVLLIVSAWGVPPLLAGIQIPGKLGATNELPNALMAFQALQIQPAQKVITSALVNTLGNQALNGGLGLGEEDFFFRRVIDVVSIGQMDTTSRMRETAAEAEAGGRDISEGLKKSIGQLPEDEAAKAVEGILRRMVDYLLRDEAA